MMMMMSRTPSLRSHPAHTFSQSVPLGLPCLPVPSPYHVPPYSPRTSSVRQTRPFIPLCCHFPCILLYIHDPCLRSLSTCPTCSILLCLMTILLCLMTCSYYVLLCPTVLPSVLFVLPSTSSVHSFCHLSVLPSVLFVLSSTSSVCPFVLLSVCSAVRLFCFLSCLCYLLLRLFVCSFVRSFVLLSVWSVVRPVCVIFYFVSSICVFYYFLTCLCISFLVRPVCEIPSNPFVKYFVSDPVHVLIFNFLPSFRSSSFLFTAFRRSTAPATGCLPYSPDPPILRLLYSVSVSIPMLGVQVILFCCL